MNLLRKNLMVAALFLASVAVEGHGGAVGTRRIELDKATDFEGGDLQGVAIDATGSVRAGFNLGKVSLLDGTTIWSALPGADGSLLLATGNEGKLLEVKDGNARVVAESKALAITSMTRAWGNSIVMGSLPGGEVLSFEGGKLTTLVKLPDTDHIWAVAFDPVQKVVYAGTGPDGKLFRIDQRGNAQVHFDAPEKHLMSVAVGRDRVYAGASDKAKLYQISGPGRATVLHDFDATEVRQIVVGDTGDVFAIANEIKAGDYTPVPQAGSEATPAKKSSGTQGKGVLYRFHPDGTPEELLADKSEHFVSLSLTDEGQPYVGTGVQGRVYTVDDVHNSVLVADTEERQIGALVLSGAHQYVVASDPAVLHPVRGIGGTDAVWTSKVLDLGLRAQFGRISWDADGELEFSSRAGNTKEPDDTWTAWSAELKAPGLITSPSARYLQVRARWSRDATAVLHQVTIPFVTDNLRAVVTALKAKGGRGGSVSDGGGDVKASGGPVSAKPEGDVALEWDVDNPDNDPLRYRLEYRLEGTPDWFQMLPPREQLTKSSYDWSTSDVPEGRYRVRVVATDELANPPDRVKRHELVSNVVVVDTTPPDLQGLTVVGRRVRGTAVDGVGPIARIEMAVTGSDEWVPFYPRDGVFDEQAEEFDIDAATLLPAGRGLLSIRVYDQNNNSVVRSVMLR